MECQTPGVQWPTVTRPADNTDALPLLSAPRLCVCGHPVYDEEPRCPLCACQEHRPRLSAAGDHGAPAAASPGTDEERKGAQPELPRGPPGTAFCDSTPLPGTCAREGSPLASSRQPLPAPPRCGPSRAHTAPVRARPDPPSGITSGPGIRPGCGRVCRARQCPPRTAAVAARSPGVALKLLLTEVTSGFAASSAAAVGTATRKHVAAARASLAGNRPAWDVSATGV